MKKKCITGLAFFLISILFFSGCQKSVDEPLATEQKEELAERGSHDKSKDDKCQFTRLIVDGFENLFYYNSRGLADEWHVNYGDGVFHDVYTMEYDRKNRLVKAWYHYDGALLATVDFVWKDKLITEEHWDYSGYLFDVVNIYNRKGQMVKREVSDGGYSADIQFDRNGNVPKIDTYFAGELVERAEYTYYKPNKSPFLAIRGIPYGFPFVSFIFSQWWETSDKTTVYENGVPTVLWDYDPKKTKIRFGPKNYPSSITYYDRVSNSEFIYGFEFQNCDRGGRYNDHSKKSSSSAVQSAKANTVKKNSPLKMAPSELIEKQIEKMKK